MSYDLVKTFFLVYEMLVFIIYHPTNQRGVRQLQGPLEGRLGQVQNRSPKRPRLLHLRVRQLEGCSTMLPILGMQRRQNVRERRMVLRLWRLRRNPTPRPSPRPCRWSLISISEVLRTSNVVIYDTLIYLSFYYHRNAIVHTLYFK